MTAAQKEWRLVAGHGTIRLHGCWVSGMDIIPENPDIIWIVPPDPDAFYQVQQINISDYRVSFDHDRATVHHHGSHDDPLFMIDLAGQPACEINLYQPVLSANCHGVLSFKDGSSKIILIEQPDNNPPSQTLESSLIGWPNGENRLSVTAPDGAELIWQTAHWGQFSEQRIELSPGQHDIPVPAFFADWLGIVISTRSLNGPIEHKYMASGNLGAASARWLLDGQTGRIFAPPQARHFAFRPVCLYLEHPPDDNLVRYIDSFHEILFCLPLAMKDWQPTSEKPFQTILWGDLDDPMIDQADWVRLPADCPLNDPRINRLGPHQRRSYSLFCDADAPDFPARLAAAVKARSAMASQAAQWLDFAWLSAHHDPDYAQQSEYSFYGMGFSFPRQEKWSTPEARQKMRTIEQSRFLRQSSPCYHCPDFDVAVCRQILPRPGPLWWPPQSTIGGNLAICADHRACMAQKV